MKELAEKFTEKQPRGEIVLVINRQEADNRKLQVANKKSITERLTELEKEGFDHKTALKKAAKEFGLSKSEAYRQIKVKK